MRKSKLEELAKRAGQFPFKIEQQQKNYASNDNEKQITLGWNISEKFIVWKQEEISCLLYPLEQECMFPTIHGSI